MLFKITTDYFMVYFKLIVPHQIVSAFGVVRFKESRGAPQQFPRKPHVVGVGGFEVSGIWMRTVRIRIRLDDPESQHL